MATTLKTELALLGIVLRDDPSDDHPPIPDGAHPVIALRLPLGQRAGIEDTDGVDPSHGDDDTPIPAGAGRRAKRLLSRLVRSGQIETWHAFVGDDGLLYVHLRFGEDMARRFFRGIDWAASTVQVSARRAEHIWLGDAA